ncbi:MAG: sodium:calcium antiporter [Candidatus Nealsonbacteria bacterium]|nr:sodium:calcium antiporter [Candidatus Nealsonbacteria bacterium]
MIFLNILIFLISCFFLAISSKWLVGALVVIAKFLGWKEFVVAFLLMAFGVTIPNFFVGIISALNKVPELSLGDVVGGNIVDLSLIIGMAALISRKGLSAPSRTVQGSSIFTIAIAILPLILIFDGALSRQDGFLLFAAFLGYMFWLFSKKERFTKAYDGIKEPVTIKFFFKNFGLFLISLIFLLLAAKGMVVSGTFFADYFSIPISLVGILVIGLGNALPEGFFSIQAARKGHDWMVLGDLMGGVVLSATLVLGTVAMISPIAVSDFLTIAIGRFFLIITALFFLIFLRTGQKITRKEAIFLIFIYVAFVVSEIAIK